MIPMQMSMMPIINHETPPQQQIGGVVKNKRFISNILHITFKQVYMYVCMYMYVMYVQIYRNLVCSKYY